MGLGRFQTALRIIVLSLFALLIGQTPIRAVGTITVNTLTDNSVNDANCTLREALIAARTDGDFNGCTGGTGTNDTIGFSVAGRITLDSGLGQLPELLEPTFIDGTTAPGYVLGGDPMVIVDGVNLAGGLDGISIFESDVTVSALAIVNFPDNGVFISSAAATGAFLRNNYIGTADGVTAEPNNIGVNVSNVAANTNILIGGLASNQGNVISGNTSHGVVINLTSLVSVYNNKIGTQDDGLTALPNGGYGVHILGNSADVIVGGAAAQRNTIAFNGSAGVFIEGTGDFNTVLHNSIFGNTDLGIDIAPAGVNLNDDDDPDTGPNDLTNFPVLISAEWDAGTLTVSGTMNTTADTNYTLQFFLNDSCDPSGYGEGETVPNTSTLNRVTDANGDDNFSHAMSTGDVVGQAVTATASIIDVGTSEFSACVTVVAPGSETPTPTETPAITNTPGGPTETPTEAITATPTELAGIELLVNGDLEADTDSDKVPDGWSQKNPTKDKQKCNKDKDGDGIPDKIVAYTGNCAYMFKGLPGENSKLQQNVDLTANDLNLGDALVLDGAVNAKGTVDAKFKVVVKYFDTSLEKTKLTVTISAETPDYLPFSSFTSELNATLTGEPSKIKVQMQNKGTSGKVYFDALSFVKSTTTSITNSLIPLP